MKKGGDGRRAIEIGGWRVWERQRERERND